jgi:acetylornithine deacetylase/succinyl-diaminopimelate desuccinylase-like protein
MMAVWRVAALLLLTCAGAASAAPPMTVAQWRGAHEAEIVGQLDRLGRLPSVAANPQGLDAAADALAGELRARGFDVQLLSVEGSPKAVFARLDVKDAKHSVTFYAHYDGQPVVPDQWKSDPFAPVMRDMKANPPADVDWHKATSPFDPEWRLFGRAVADDKVSIAAFLSAFDALKASGRKPNVNLRVFWEGEEEAGSAHLAQILAANAALLKSDLWLIGDGAMHQSRAPTLYFGARGILGLTATVYGPLTPLHDGHYGNWAPNPAAMAARLIAQMRDDDGTILIPGVADAARPMTSADAQAIAALPKVEDSLLTTFGLGRSETDSLTAATMQPALNIRGISAGAVGADANNAIPAEASFSIDFRLVPDQTVDGVEKSVEAFLSDKGWSVVRDAPDLNLRLERPRLVRLSWDPGYPGFRTDIGLPVSRAVIAAAGKATGKQVAVLPMMGASVPLYIFDAALKAPLIGLPIANHDDSQHAPNENLRLQNLWDGIDLYAAMMSGLDW